MRISNYQRTLDYLYTQLPMFQRIGPAAFKKDLSNTLALCSALGNPQENFNAIHLAGTNGKGSTAHLLSAVLQEMGLKVGVYTSPHYKDFRERIKINGQYIPKKTVTEFVDHHQEKFKEIGPSFFEITVAMAFTYFADQKVDIAIIETGLGGRLDSTNIITPLIAVITNISFDHQQFLGNSLAAIAGEKAGIIKPNIPVVIGEEQDETTSIFIKKAKKEKAPIHFAAQYYQAELLNADSHHSIYRIHRKNKLWAAALPINIHGPYQQKNIITALMTLEILNDLNLFPTITSTLIESGWADLKAKTSFLGRWQLLGQAPTIIADSAHNEGGLGIVLTKIQAIPHQQLHLVFGTVSDKEVAKIFPLFPVDATYYFVKANIPRGFEAGALQEAAAPFGLKGKRYVSVRRGLAAAKRKAKPSDLIVILGSIFVVAEVI